MEEKQNKPVMKSACPKCGEPIAFYKPEQPGIMRFKCRKCGHLFGVKINEVEIKLPADNNADKNNVSENAKTDIVAGGETQKMRPSGIPPSPSSGRCEMKTDRIRQRAEFSHIASVRQKGRHFYNSDKLHGLKEGDNVIGRRDNTWMSDIMIDNDSVMSRRSVCITVENGKTGYGYLLKVMKSTNPVILNGKALAENTQLYIVPGDEFILGTTHFILE